MFGLQGVALVVFDIIAIPFLYPRSCKGRNVFSSVDNVQEKYVLRNVPVVRHSRLHPIARSVHDQSPPAPVCAHVALVGSMSSTSPVISLPPAK